MRGKRLAVWIAGGLVLVLLLFSAASAMAGRGFRPLGLFAVDNHAETAGTLPVIEASRGTKAESAPESSAAAEGPGPTEGYASEEASAATETSATIETSAATEASTAIETSAATEMSAATEESAGADTAVMTEESVPAESSAGTEGPVSREETEAVTETPAPAETAPATEAAAETPAAATAETSPASSEARAFYPADLLAHLAAAGRNPESLQGSQLLVVKGLEKPKCIVYAYEKTAEGWRALDWLSGIPGIMGRDGMNDHTPEDHKYTPIGYFGLGPAYGEAAWEDTGLEYYQIQSEDYYVVDPNSKYYNQLYKSHYDDKDWEYAEEMISLLEFYEYCIYVQHNVNPIIPNEGSAIFVHIDRLDNSTSGCIGVEKWVMQALFKWMRAEADPHILLYPGN